MVNLSGGGRRGAMTIPFLRRCDVFEVEIDFLIAFEEQSKL